MAVQGRSDLQNFSLILHGETLVKDNETLLQDAGRSAPMLCGTVMAQIAATLKWVPLDDIALTTGAGLAKGVYLGDDVTAAALVAGDVTGALILAGGAAATLDGSLVVFENSLTAATVVEAATVQARTIADDLARIGIFLEATIDIDELEN